jgi:hypothetical protein
VARSSAVTIPVDTTCRLRRTTSATSLARSVARPAARGVALRPSRQASCRRARLQPGGVTRPLFVYSPAVRLPRTSSSHRARTKSPCVSVRGSARRANRAALTANHSFEGGTGNPSGGESDLQSKHRTQRAGRPSAKSDTGIAAPSATLARQHLGPVSGVSDQRGQMSRSQPGITDLRVIARTRGLNAPANVGRDEIVARLHDLEAPGDPADVAEHSTRNAPPERKGWWVSRSVSELRAVAREHGINIPARTRRQELVDLLIAYDIPRPSGPGSQTKCRPT